MEDFDSKRTFGWSRCFCSSILGVNLCSQVGFENMFWSLFGLLKLCHYASVRELNQNCNLPQNRNMW